jgi:hypothetical protein
VRVVGAKPGASLRPVPPRSRTRHRAALAGTAAGAAALALSGAAVAMSGVLSGVLSSSGGHHQQLAGGPLHGPGGPAPSSPVPPLRSGSRPVPSSGGQGSGNPPAGLALGSHAASPGSQSAAAPAGGASPVAPKQLLLPGGTTAPPISAPTAPTSPVASPPAPAPVVVVIIRPDIPPPSSPAPVIVPPVPVVPAPVVPAPVVAVPVVAVPVVAVPVVAVPVVAVPPRTVSIASAPPATCDTDSKTQREGDGHAARRGGDQASEEHSEAHEDDCPGVPAAGAGAQHGDAGGRGDAAHHGDAGGRGSDDPSELLSRSGPVATGVERGAGAGAGAGHEDSGGRDSVHSRSSSSR